MAPRVGVKDSHALAWPLELGFRTPTLAVARRVGVKDSHALPWPLKLGLRTPTLCRGPSSWG